MPKNTVSANQPKMKAKKVAGRPMGKKAARAAAKNNAVVEQFVSILAAAESQADLAILQTEALQLGRVVRQLGGNRLEIRLMDPAAEEHVKLPIGGNVRGGRAAARGDRANSMLADDIVVIRGAQVAAKIPPSVAAALRDLLDALDVAVPKGFFAAAGDSEEEDAFEFVEDDDDEADAAEAEEEEVCIDDI